MVAADVKCYHCGYISGELVAEDPNATKPFIFRPAKGYSKPLPKPGEAIRCGRCGGPVYLDDLRTIHFRADEPIPKAKRRRRWAKKPIAMAG
ncbi:MAG: hypothetical protein M1358_18150 [Chloroflexi bacterium]|nr:hypothetical protein [Chloroflexota bacterium]